MLNYSQDETCTNTSVSISKSDVASDETNSNVNIQPPRGDNNPLVHSNAKLPPKPKIGTRFSRQIKVNPNNNVPSNLRRPSNAPPRNAPPKGNVKNDQSGQRSLSVSQPSSSTSNTSEKQILLSNSSNPTTSPSPVEVNNASNPTQVNTESKDNDDINQSSSSSDSVVSSKKEKSGFSLWPFKKKGTSMLNQ